MIYDKEYYETGNYVDYNERSLKYKKLATELSSLLKQLNLIDEYTSILDYGCATGHLLEGFNSLGYYNICGVDISEYARTQCYNRGLNVCYPYDDISVDIFIALDVFEHMTDEEIYKILRTTSMDTAIVRMPVASVLGGDFHLDISKKDLTHINCKTSGEWKDLFYNYFSCILDLNLTSIYSSPGVASLLLIK